MELEQSIIYLANQLQQVPFFKQQLEEDKKKDNGGQKFEF